MRKTLTFTCKLIATSIKASVSLRTAFLIEAGLLLANNLIFFSIWFIFFQQFNDIKGWQFQDMITLIAVGTGGYGIMRVCFGGTRDLSKRIINGDLDPFMTQPKSLLIHLLGARSFARGWGHLTTTGILIFFGGLTKMDIFPLVILGIICSALIFTSTNVLAHSLAFWMGPTDNISERYGDALFLFSLYPANIYSGFLEAVMFTVMPAGIIGYLPVELVRNFSWTTLFVLIGSTVIFCFLAHTVFNAGLKRYESGNQFGVRI